MRLFSCDVCGKTLNPDTDAHFVWKIDGHALTPVDDNTLLEENDSDDDSVDLVDELLLEREQLEQDGNDPETIEMLPVCVRRSFDVCGGCYMKLVKDPLGLESRNARPFSRN